MNNTRLYTYNTIVEKTININFEKIYKVLVEENNTKDIGRLYEDFGDNIDYYLEKVLGIKLDEDIPDYYNDVLQDISYLEDSIWEDFWDFLKEKHEYYDE